MTAAAVVAACQAFPWDAHRPRRIGAQVAVYETGHSPCETAPHQLVRDMLAMFAEVDGLPDPVDAGE